LNRLSVPQLQNRLTAEGRQSEIILQWKDWSGREDLNFRPRPEFKTLPNFVGIWRA
jgi:hypothetical protein